MLSDGKGGNRLDPLSFSFCLLLLVYRINRGKRGKAERREERCVFCFVFYTLLFLRFVSWAGEGVQGGASRLCMGGFYSGIGVPETSKCGEAHPGGFTVCLQAVLSLLQHPHCYTSIPPTKTHRKKISYHSFFLCLFTSV